EVAISTSFDGGEHWTTPRRANTFTGRPAFTATVAVNEHSVVGVTYYDFRTLQAGNTTTLPTGYFLRKSHIGGLDFGRDIVVSTPFDMKTAPQAGGFFVGDYEGLVGNGERFQPFFVKANDGNVTNRTDV